MVSHCKYNYYFPFHLNALSFENGMFQGQIRIMYLSLPGLVTELSVDQLTEGIREDCKISHLVQL